MNEIVVEELREIGQFDGCCSKETFQTNLKSSSNFSQSHHNLRKKEYVKTYEVKD